MGKWLAVLAVACGCVYAQVNQDQLARHRNLGKAFFENPTTGPQAVEEFRKALALSGADRDRMNLGLAMNKAGMVKEAMAELERVQKSSPQLPHTWFNLGILYNREGRPEDAARQFEQLIKLAPKEPIAYHNLGVAYSHSNREPQAIKAFEMAAQINPDFAAPHFQLYNIHRLADRPNDAAREIKTFLALKKVMEENDSSEDPEWCDFGEIYDPLNDTRPPRAPAPVWEATSLNRKLTPAGSGIAVFDLLGAGQADALVWSAEGITVLRRGREPVANTGLETLRGVLHVATGDLDNDALPDLAVVTAKETFIYANRKGRFERLRAIPGSFDSAVWLDFDRDYDQDLILLGAESRLYRNQGADGFADVSSRFPFVPGHALRAEVFRLVPDTKAIDLRVFYQDGSSVLYRDGLMGRYRAEKTAAVPPPAPPAGIAAAAWAAADFDADGRDEILSVAPDGSLSLYRNRAPRQNWIRVHLTGTKNLKLGFTAEIEIKAGLLYQKKMYFGVPLSFEFENLPEVDTVRITWPNGLMQNEAHQVAGKSYSYKEAQRLSGSCPMIWTWNGSGFEYITDVLGVAPLGASSGDGEIFPVDHDEYVFIPGDKLRREGNHYEVRITEELAEISYLDQVRLFAVDHPAGTDIFTNEKFKGPPYPEHRLFGVSRRIAPVRATDHRGASVLDLVARRDQRYPTSFRRTEAGTAEPWSLTLDFGRAAADNRAILVLHGWVDWADGSTFLGAAQQKGLSLQTPSLQVKDAAGRWQTVIEDMGLPAGKPKTIVVDLTGKFLSDSREVRILTNLCLYWDEIFLSEETGAPLQHTTELKLASADLRFRGFSPATIHPQRLQPETFTYSNPSPTSMWNPTPGLYTRFGDVTPLLAKEDDRLVIMGSGDEARLLFDASALDDPPAGWRRDYLLLVDGWAKDSDANTAFSQSVEPLPFHGMSAYPYPATERHPDPDYHREWNTRPALRLMPELTRRPTSAPARVRPPRPASGSPALP